MTSVIEGKQYLPDPGFDEGWSTPGDGGSRTWYIPPIEGYNPDEWGSQPRSDFLIGANMDTMEVQPSFEVWQETPGQALRLASTFGSGALTLNQGGSGVKHPINPDRRYVLSLRKRIIDAGLHGRAFIRVYWYAFNGTSSRGWSDIGKEDWDNSHDEGLGPGVYSYQEVLTPPGEDLAWPDGSYWARVEIRINGEGGSGDGSGYVDALFDDLRFAVYREAPAPPDDTTPPDSFNDEVGGWLYDALRPVADPYDAARGYPLLAYANGIGAMFQPIYDIVRDPNILLDPDRSPVEWLPFIGQFVGQPIKGERLPTESPLAYRDRIKPLLKDPPHRRRGTVPAIIEEVKSFLIDGATVYAIERVGGNLYIGTISILNDQLKVGATVAQIQARIEEIQPAGRLITVVGLDDALTWTAVKATHADWADVLSTFEDWAEVKSDPTKT